MSPLHIFDLFTHYELHLFIPLALTCWYAHKLDKRSAMMTKAVEDLEKHCVEHEERLDDHDVKIATLDTKVCYLNQKRDQ